MRIFKAGAFFGNARRWAYMACAFVVRVGSALDVTMLPGFLPVFREDVGGREK